MKVIIVGGSLAGLMHGVLLKSLGHDVHILEQWKEQVRHGDAAGIRVGPQAQEYFSRFDRTGESYFLDCPGINFINKDSKPIRFINSPMSMTAWTTLYFRLRAHFDGYPSKHCPNIPEPLAKDGQTLYDLGKKVIDLAPLPNNQGVSLTVEDVRTNKTSTLTADLVLAADGSNSSIRNLLLPTLPRPYAGYVAWRGGVPTTTLTPSTLATCASNFTVFKMPQNYILVYRIPGPTPGTEVLNWVWYTNISSDPSTALDEILTDIHGHRHHRTLPPGLIRPDQWLSRVSTATTSLPAPFAELVQKTKEPFVTAVSDCISPRAAFFSGRLLLVGDAVAQFRPHVAMSVNQAAVDALLLEQYLAGEISVGEWENRVLQYARETGALSRMVGDWTQRGVFSAAVSAVKYVWVRVWGKIRGTGVK